MPWIQKVIPVFQENTKLKLDYTLCPFGVKNGSEILVFESVGGRNRFLMQNLGLILKR